jgi:hypothetical protein
MAGWRSGDGCLLSILGESAVTSDPNLTVSVRVRTISNAFFFFLSFSYATRTNVAAREVNVVSPAQVGSSHQEECTGSRVVCVCVCAREGTQNANGI